MQSNNLVTPAPMVQGLVLREWLIHHANRDGVWGEVVAEFYSRAAQVPQVAAYFANVEWSRLQEHFTRALMIVTGDGIREGTVRYLQDKHARVRDADGRPITPEIYDVVISTLVSVLSAHGVPPSGINALAQTIAPLRDVISRRAQDVAS